MSDLISRADAITAFTIDGTRMERLGLYMLTVAEAKQKAVDLLEALSSADAAEVIRKAVKGYEGYYEVDQFGRVFSIEREVIVNDNGRIYKKTIRGKKLKQSVHTCGYKTVSLTKNGKTKTAYVHRVVAEAFIDNPNNLPYINHKDEDKTNNFAENLEWCTASYNNTYNKKNVKHSKKIKGRKLTEEHKKKISNSLKRYHREDGEEE